MSALLANVRRWYEAQSSPRLNYAILALILTFFVYAFLVLEERVQMAKAVVEDLQSQLAELEDETSLAEWAGRAKAAADAAHAWALREWSATTYGIAAAEIQADLTQILADADLFQTRINVDPQPLTVRGEEVLRFEFFATGLTEDMLFLLGRLAQDERRLLIIDFDLGLFGGEGSVRVSGVAPVRLQGAEAAAESGAQ